MRRVVTLLAVFCIGGAWACDTPAEQPTPPITAQTDAAISPDGDPQDRDGAVPIDGGKPRKDGASIDGSGPYGALEGLQNNELRIALNDRIANHTSLGYDAARDAMLGVSGTFDLSGGMLECVYTGRTVLPDGTRSPNGFNTEHTWPQSLGASSEPMRSDLHHLYPVDENANNARGSFPFGDTACAASTCNYENGGSQLGAIVGGTATVFEVRPLRRGDVARGIFYFAVRYDKSIDAPQEAALRVWNDADPPDALEEARNDAIEGYQKNRNPFVDRPDFVDRILDF